MKNERQTFFTERDIELHRRNAKNYAAWQKKYNARPKWTAWEDNPVYEFPTYLRMKAAI